MSDLISRNEMLRTYQELCRNITCSECSSYFCDALTGDCLLEKWIHSLPSAEKTQLSEEDATSDLISRKEATTIPVMPKEHREYQTMNLDDAYEQGWLDCQKCIEDLPSAEPTIIRCRDCKHHDGIRCFRWNSTIITGFDDFCSNAEKRGEEDE